MPTTVMFDGGPVEFDNRTPHELRIYNMDKTDGKEVNEDGLTGMGLKVSNLNGWVPRVTHCCITRVASLMNLMSQMPCGIYTVTSPRSGKSSSLPMPLATWKILLIREENTDMTTIYYIPGIASCIIMLGLGIGLLVKGENDLGATILGMVSTILGAAWLFVYLGMLMGW